MPSTSSPIDPKNFYASLASDPVEQTVDVPAALVSVETPVSRKFSGYWPYTSMHALRDERMHALGSEMRGKFAGPIPVTYFLDHYLPISDEARQSMPKFDKHRHRFAKVASAKCEKDMYESMIAALSPFCSDDFELVDTHAHADTLNMERDQPEMKPDLGIYEKNRGRHDVTDFAALDHHMEFKFHPGDDPFCDINDSFTYQNGKFEHHTYASSDSRGQITSYVSAQAAIQFRTHIFSVVICRSSARLLRWDRSGAVVSRSFPYSKLSYLAEYIWRYTRSTPTARGWDETVTKATDTDLGVVEAKEALGLKSDQPLFKFAVYQDKEKVDGKETGSLDEGVENKDPDFKTPSSDNVGDQPHVAYYYGSKPKVRASISPTGRSTRVYAAYDPITKWIVLLKDTWRINLPDVEKEGEIYKLLHAAKVNHIPHCLRCGDIPLQHHKTATDGFRSIFKLQLRPHAHYRMVLREVGGELIKFQTIKEIVCAMRDAIQAHSEAYEKAGILHRDISVGNIMLYDGGGLLIDWDLSKIKERIGTAARQAERSGTWQFIAGRLLRDDDSIHTLQDDLESFLHVLSWVVLRFTRHDLTPLRLTSIMTTVFDAAFRGDDGSVDPGPAKINFIMSNEVTSDRIGLPRGELWDLLYDLADTFAVRYAKPPTERDEQIYQELREKCISPEDFLKLSEYRLPAGHYHDRQRRLESGTWMHTRFKQAADGTDWPTGKEQRVENVLDYPKREALKRKQEDEDDDGDYKRSQKQRLDNPPCQDSSEDDASSETPGNDDGKSEYDGIDPAIFEPYDYRNPGS